MNTEKNILNLAPCDLSSLQDLPLENFHHAQIIIKSEPLKRKEEIYYLYIVFSLNRASYDDKHFDKSSSILMNSVLI